MPKKLAFQSELERKLKDFNINDFWFLLEDLTKEEKPLIMQMFYFEKEVILYFEPKKQDLRFCMMNTFEIIKERSKNKFLKYSYKSSKMEVDIIYNKRKFIRKFYKALFELFDSYKDVAYFEPPIIDFEYWIKDSKIIRNYLHLK